MILDIKWEVIENYIGFGRIDAPVVFIGMEEGAPGNLSELKSNLIDRSLFDSVTALRENKRIIKTWRPICDFMLRIGGNSDPDRKSRLQYQNGILGKPFGDTLLMELMPYPSQNMKQWPYGLLGRDASRSAYIARLLPARARMIRNVISGSKREYVICYGKSYSGHFKDLFPNNLEWRSEGGFEISEWNGQKLAIVPHFCSRFFNSNEQLAEFYRIVGRGIPCEKLPIA